MFGRRVQVVAHLVVPGLDLNSLVILIIDLFLEKFDNNLLKSELFSLWQEFIFLFWMIIKLIVQFDLFGLVKVWYYLLSGIVCCMVLFRCLVQQTFCDFNASNIIINSSYIYILMRCYAVGSSERECCGYNCERFLCLQFKLKTLQLSQLKTAPIPIRHISRFYRQENGNIYYRHLQ